jgi:hypothetical protein
VERDFRPYKRYLSDDAYLELCRPFGIVFLQWPQQEQPRGLQHRQAHGSRFLLVEPVPEYKTPLSASEDEHSVGRQRRSKKSGSQELAAGGRGIRTLGPSAKESVSLSERRSAGEVQ